MNPNFDLNIENYTRRELMDIFGLPAKFDINILEMKEAKMRDNIINNKQINKETQTQTLNFLVKAKNIILNENPNPRNGELIQQIEDFYNSSYDLKPTKLGESQEHMLQVRQEKPYLSSYPSEFFAGVINPLKKRTLKKNLNIDTRFRENYFNTSSTNFNLALPTQFNDVVQMQLMSLELPTSYYAISNNYGNNYFTIKISLSNSTSSSAVIIIPNGNYTEQTIIDAINDQLTNEGGLFTYVSFGVELVGSETGTAKTTVAPNSSAPVSPNPVITTIELNFQADKNGGEDKNMPLQLKLGWILGFRAGLYLGETSYTSESIVDTVRPKYIYLVVDDYNNNVNNSFYSAFNQSILNKNILARISLTQSAFNIINQNNLNLVTTPRDYFGPVNIHTMNIQLLDEYGRIVDLNGMDYSFCLTLTTVYDI
jgi:hypothetical protein